MLSRELIVVVASLTIVIIGSRYRLPLGASLSAAATLLLTALAPYKLASALVNSVLDEGAIYLILTSSLIALFAEAYSRSGLVRELCEGLVRSLSHSVSISLVPAVLGLLPVAGGALLSAPIVEVVSVSMGLSPALAAFANVWFRHTIFMFYPLSQVLITASVLSGYSVEEIALRQVPTALFMVALGYAILYLRRGPAREVEVSGSTRILEPLLPLASAVGFALAIRVLLGKWGIPLGVLIGCFTLAAVVRNVRVVAESAVSRRVFDIAFAAFAAYYMRNAFMLTGASSAILDTLMSFGLPKLVLESLLPAFLGVATGSPLTAVVLAISMFKGVGELSIFDVNVIYVASFLGYLAAPTHLCLVYTAEYFREDLTSIYKYLLPATFATFAFALVTLALMPL